MLPFSWLLVLLSTLALTLLFKSLFFASPSRIKALLDILFHAFSQLIQVFSKALLVLVLSDKLGV